MRKLLCAFAAVLLFGVAVHLSQPKTAQASLGTLHEVWNEEWTTTSAIASTTLITPTVDTTYTVFLYETVTGTGTPSDIFRPEFTWTDDAGNEQLGGSSSAGNYPIPWGFGGNSGAYSGGGAALPLLPYIGFGDSTNGGPYVATFPVRVKANTSLVFQMPVTNPDNLTAHVSVQVMGW